MPSILSRIGSWLGFGDQSPPKRQRSGTGQFRARYDAADTNQENYRHWANTDALSARQANSLPVRQRLRERSRYEFANNGYAQGLTLTLADDLVGTGPTLQVMTSDRAANQAIEAAFAAWCEAIGLAEKLHTMKQAKTRDGEAFALFTTNDLLPTSVQLDLKLIECDQVTTRSLDPSFLKPGWVDGIEFDQQGNPTVYHVLRYHPGDALAFGAAFGAIDKIPARQVLHWFRADRPGQARGIPELTPSIPLFAQLRRYTLATLTAAELAAEMTLYLKSEMPADAEDVPVAEPFETLEVDRGMFTTLPAGSEPFQLQATQPTTLYEMFKKELLKEIARPVSVPFNIVSCDSSGYNYSSARLEHLIYRARVRVERNHCRRNILERIFAAWLTEATRIPKLLPPLPAGVSYFTLPHTWYWPGFESMDPAKDAAADTERLNNGTTTLLEILAEYNQDWEAFLRQRARELDLARSLNVPFPTPAGAAKPPAPAPADTQANASHPLRAADQPREPAGSPEGGQFASKEDHVAALKDLWETAGTGGHTDEHFEKELGRLDELSKSELVEVAKATEMFGADKKSAKALRKDIRERMNLRRGATQRSKLMHPWDRKPRAQAGVSLRAADQPRVPPGSPEGGQFAGDEDWQSEHEPSPEHLERHDREEGTLLKKHQAERRDLQEKLDREQVALNKQTLALDRERRQRDTARKKEDRQRSAARKEESKHLRERKAAPEEIQQVRERREEEDAEIDERRGREDDAHDAREQAHEAKVEDFWEREEASKADLKDRQEQEYKDPLQRQNDEDRADYERQKAASGA